MAGPQLPRSLLACNIGYAWGCEANPTRNLHFWGAPFPHTHVWLESGGSKLAVFACRARRRACRARTPSQGRGTGHAGQRPKPGASSHSVDIWVWLKMKREGQTAGGPCFHLPGFHVPFFFLATRHFATFLRPNENSPPNADKSGATWIASARES